MTVIVILDRSPFAGTANLIRILLPHKQTAVTQDDVLVTYANIQVQYSRHPNADRWCYVVSSLTDIPGLVRMAYRNDFDPEHLRAVLPQIRRHLPLDDRASRMLWFETLTAHAVYNTGIDTVDAI